MERSPIKPLVRYPLIGFSNTSHLIRGGENGALEVSSNFSI